MSKKLKKCPFCGKKASIQDCSYFGSTPMWSAMCDNPKCFAYTEAFKTKKEAIERWNSRPAEEALQKRIEELEAEGDDFGEVAEMIVWLYSDEHQERLDNGLRIDGFYSHEWLDMILDMAREALEGAEE